MGTDCLVIANTNTSTDERRAQSLTANSLKARLRHGVDVLRKNHFHPLSIPRYVRERQEMQRVLDEQSRLLIEPHDLDAIER